MHGSAPHAPRPRRLLGLAVAAVAVLAAGPGCTRKFYRERADKDVAGVLTQKNVFPDWQIANWHVYPDPRARYSDPANPDRPPYPPDDYAARVLSPNPQRPGKKAGAGRFEGYGYAEYLARWDAENRALAGRTDDQKRDGTPDQKRDGTPDLPIPKPGDRPAEKLPPPQPVAPPPMLPEPPAPPAGPKAATPPAGPPVLPGTLVPATPPLAASRPGSPPATPQVAPAANPRAARPGIPGLTAGTPSAANPARPAPDVVGPPAPTAAGARPPQPRQGVIVVAGEVPDGNRMIPAVIAIPTAQPPTGGAGAPPGAAGGAGRDPAAGQDRPPGGAGRPGQDDQVAVVATGDQAFDFLRALTADDRCAYRIKMEQAVELGLFNSREFQDRREDLYLAALPVTLERFSFAAQGFFTESAVLDFAGRALGRTPRNRGTFNTDAGFQKLFPTGALLLVRLANQVVVDLTGDRPTTTVSNLTLNLAQPLLRGGGRAVTLEDLTQAERNLLYAIRSYARFRKLFYVAITAGGDYTNNPYGLQGLSPNLGRGVGSNLTAPRAGYLPLLLQAAIIANQRQNIIALEDLLRQYRAYAEGGQIPDIQVGQVEQDLLGARTNLLGQAQAQAGGGGGGGGVRGLLGTVDNFKLQLGLPATVGLDLDDSPLRPIRGQLARFEDVYAQTREAEAAARRFDPAEPVDQFRPRWQRLLTETPLVRGTEFGRGIANRWAAWARLTDDQLTRRLADLAEERRKLLDARADRQAKGLPEPEDAAGRLAAVEAEIDLGRFERAARAYEARPWLRPAAEISQAAAFRDVFNAFYQLILEARNERLQQVRGRWPKLPPLLVDGVDLLEVPLDDAYTAGIRAALTHRLDLMNARAQVVDAWRKIAVAANSLQGAFDVEYNLSSSTPPGGTNPLAFSGARTSHQLAFNAELPLVRRVERNNYRAALVSYQRQRRLLQAFEDNIATDVRNDVRELRAIAELYRIQQRLIELGYSQVDSARETQFAPLAAGVQPDPASSAALTQQVLRAQDSLLRAQNTLYTIWVAYTTARMGLYLDLELMRLDDRGVWCDEFLPGNEDPDRRGPEPDPGRPGDRLPAPRPVPDPGRGG